MATVLLGMPLYKHDVNFMASLAFARPTKNKDLKVLQAGSRFSLLSDNCNSLWCMALNEGADYFAMLHSDVAVTEGWLDALIEELEEHGADMVSQVVPIKTTEEGLVSTAVEIAGDEPRRMTYGELSELPMTFDANDVADRFHPLDRPSHLLVNTGCMVCRISDKMRMTKDGRAIVYFTINDRVWLGDDGKWQHAVDPEDWFFSRRVADVGGRVMVTQRLTVDHWGERPWTFRARE